MVDPGAGGTGAALLLVAGEGTFATHVLAGRDLVIGRGDGCDVQIDHRVLSRRHAKCAGPPRWTAGSDSERHDATVWPR